MSGGLLVNALLRETGHPVTSEQAEQLPRFHAEAYGRMVGQVRPLPGANPLLSCLTKNGIPWAIATSGEMESARRTLKVLRIGPETVLITRDQITPPHPHPDIFFPP